MKDPYAEFSDVADEYNSFSEVVDAGSTTSPGFFGRLKESITGEERRTPETEGAADWATMPELNSFSLASAKTGLGTLLSNPEETVQVIRSNFPSVQARQDEMGNYLLRSSIDGNEYAIKPGFRVSDIPRAVGGVAAFTPAGRAVGTGIGLAARAGGGALARTAAGAGAGALASGATQLGIEGSQAATGGEADAGEVGIAAALGGAAPLVASAGRAVLQPVRSAVSRLTGAPKAASAPGTVPPSASTAPPPEPATTQVLAQTAKKAAEGGLGSSSARKVLAGQVDADPEALAAAERLGITEHLQPDHVSTNQSYRELAQAIKSFPGSQTRKAELQGLQEVGRRADDLITELGGTDDVSTVSANVKQSLMSTQQALERKADKLYAEVAAKIPRGESVTAPSTAGFLRQQAADLGGADRLLPVERHLLTTLTDPARQPTYAFLDRSRRQIGDALQKVSGPFKDSDQGLLRSLYKTLSEDQNAVAASHGVGELYSAAKQSVSVRKGIEDDLTALFGKTLDRSLMGALTDSVSSLAKGDSEKLIRFLKSVPEPLRQQVTASGLKTAFGKSTQNGSLNFGSYVNWFEGLQRNRQAYTALMVNLPAEASGRLVDLYRVSKGISLASKQYITTGRLQVMKDELQGADGLMASIYSLAKRSSAGAAAEAVTTPLGLPGAGISAAIASALTKGKPNVMKAADELISSPEFEQMAKQPTVQQQRAAARKLASSAKFSKFSNALGNPKELSNRERWILQAVQARSASNDSGG